MSAEYVRKHYGVDYKRGERLIVDGMPGTLVSFPGQYLGIRFDGEKFTSRAHPTSGVRRAGQPLPKTCRECGAWSEQDHDRCLRLAGRSPA
jgi:hypothetical protein